MSQERDRLGLLGVGDHDAEVAGSLSGLQRLNTPRYNKVSKSPPPTTGIQKLQLQLASDWKILAFRE